MKPCTVHIWRDEAPDDEDMLPWRLCVRCGRRERRPWTVDEARERGIVAVLTGVAVWNDERLRYERRAD